ncbi:MAG TPA: diguanylate cyclase [Smithellaceae bacterium]|nr:diguanylate cyclase [Smithellaceae bacterium]
MSNASIPVILMCAIAFYVGLYHLFFYFIRKESKMNFYFAAICFSIGMYDVACVGLYNSFSVSSGIFWQKCQYFTIQLSIVSFLYFTYYLVGRKKDWIMTSCCIMMAVMFILGIVFNDHLFSLDDPIVREVGGYFFSVIYYEARPAVLMNILYAFLFIVMVYICSLIIRERRTDLLPLIIGFCIFFISSVADILIGAELFNFVYTAEYAFLVIIFMMDYALLRRFVGLFFEIEDMNVKLEEKVAERTVRIQNMADEVLSINKKLENKNLMLAELVERDSLTKLYNHAAFQKKLAETVNLAGRQSYKFCVAMMDIDWFKQINDHHGHLVGDQVIRKVADILSSRPADALQDMPGRKISASQGLRNYDIAARYGGDEFALVLCYCDEKGIKTVTDRVSQAVRDIVIEGCPDISVTLSIGAVVIADPSVCRDGKDIIRRADRSLYMAKEQGRNCVVIAAYGE